MQTNLHPTNNLCRIFSARSRAQQRTKALIAARGAMFDRDATPAKLLADCKTLMRDGDQTDYARAEMIRARIRRKIRTAITSAGTHGGAA